jgi:hypothetical protein
MEVDFSEGRELYTDIQAFQTFQEMSLSIDSRLEYLTFFAPDPSGILV